MKVFLDDRHPAPDETWVLVKTPSAAISLLETGEVELISFDHDLGYEGEVELTGNQVLLWIPGAFGFTKTAKDGAGHNTSWDLTRLSSSGPAAAGELPTAAPQLAWVMPFRMPDISGAVSAQVRSGTCR